MGKPLIKVQVGILLIMGGRSVEKVCTFSTNFPCFLWSPLPYQHRIRSTHVVGTGTKLRLNERNNPTTNNRVQISRARARVARRRLLPRGELSVGRSLARSYKLVTTNLDAAHSRTQSPEEEQRTIIKFTALTPNTSAVPFSSAIWNPSDVGLFKEDRTSLVFKSYCYNWALLV